METPFARSYWVLPGLLLAGYYPGALDPAERDEKLSALLDCGIRLVINLMESDETDWEVRPFEPYAPQLISLASLRGISVDCLSFPIRDGGVPERDRLSQALDAIDAAVIAAKPVYVHCWGGKGRTGTVIGCYLARHGIAVGDAALAHITQLRRNDSQATEASPETTAQRELVRGWRQGW